MGEGRRGGEEGISNMEKATGRNEREKKGRGEGEKQQEIKKDIRQHSMLY